MYIKILNKFKYIINKYTKLNLIIKYKKINYLKNEK